MGVEKQGEAALGLGEAGAALVDARPAGAALERGAVENHIFSF